MLKKTTTIILALSVLASQAVAGELTIEERKAKMRERAEAAEARLSETSMTIEEKKKKLEENLAAAIQRQKEKCTGEVASGHLSDRCKQIAERIKKGESLKDILIKRGETIDEKRERIKAQTQAMEERMADRRKKRSDQ